MSVKLLFPASSAEVSLKGIRGCCVWPGSTPQGEGPVDAGCWSPYQGGGSLQEGGLARSETWFWIVPIIQRVGHWGAWRPSGWVSPAVNQPQQPVCLLHRLWDQICPRDEAQGPWRLQYPGAPDTDTSAQSFPVTVPEPSATEPGVWKAVLYVTLTLHGVPVPSKLSPGPAQAAWVMPLYGALRWSVMGQGRRMTWGWSTAIPSRGLSKG